MKSNFYSVFGIATTATADEIKSRFRFLSHAYHPDKFGSDAHRRIAEQEFKRINEAYQVLSDPTQRAKFDASRSRASAPPPAPEPPPPRPEPPRAAAAPPPTDTPNRKGFGRGACFGWLVAITFVSSIFSASKDANFLGTWVVLTCFIPVVLRLRDIGTSGWWCLVGFIPLINFVLGYYLLCVPSGYAQHRQIDRTMKVLSTIFIVFIALVLLIIVMAVTK